MTQAYNLAILANAVDSSGKLNVATNSTGVLPVANGGTGSSSPSLVAGTGISITGSFPNQTVTSTVTGGVTSLNGQTGAITNTDLNAIGSYTVGRPQNTSGYARNTTLAGSSLYSIGIGNMMYNGDWYNWQTGSSDVGQVLVNTGTWRAMNTLVSGGGNGFAGLWVRIS